MKLYININIQLNIIFLLFFLFERIPRVEQAVIHASKPLLNKTELN